MSVKVTIIENGPALIEDEDDYLLIQCKMGIFPPGDVVTKKVAICRCGKSADGVWCDGSHKFKTIEENAEIQ